MEQICCFTLMRSTIIKKASQDEQQNQTTITTNFNYIQNLCPIKKKLQKIKVASDKTETKQNNFYSLGKIWVHSLKKLGNN